MAGAGAGAMSGSDHRPCRLYHPRPRRNLTCQVAAIEACALTTERPEGIGAPEPVHCSPSQASTESSFGSLPLLRRFDIPQAELEIRDASEERRRRWVEDVNNRIREARARHARSRRRWARNRIVIVIVSSVMFAISLSVVVVLELTL